MRNDTWPGQSLPTPLTNFPGYRLLTKLCLHKSKIAQGMHDEAMLLLGHIKVGDQRLHEVLDANAASSSGEAKAFVLGASETKPSFFLPAAPTLVLSVLVQMFLKKEEGEVSPEKLTREYFWGQTTRRSSLAAALSGRRCRLAPQFHG